MAKIYSASSSKFKEVNVEEVIKMGRDLIEQANSHFTGNVSPLRSPSISSQTSIEEAGQVSCSLLRSQVLKVSTYY